MQEKHRKVIGIVGGSHRDGNTECLVDEVLAGAQEGGAEIKKCILNKLHINLSGMWREVRYDHALLATAHKVGREVV
ncbi:MAG: hypothetical protein PVG65_06350 [Candidatus Thorarchaeota archaeon]|jgi:multimeric flavodoxin WrbA